MAVGLLGFAQTSAAHASQFGIELFVPFILGSLYLILLSATLLPLVGICLSDFVLIISSSVLKFLPYPIICSEILFLSESLRIPLNLLNSHNCPLAHQPWLPGVQSVELLCFLGFQSHPVSGYLSRPLRVSES